MTEWHEATPQVEPEWDGALRVEARGFKWMRRYDGYYLPVSVPVASVTGAVKARELQDGFGPVTVLVDGLGRKVKAPRTFYRRAVA